MTFAEELRGFELHLRAERNLSEHTRRAYASDCPGYRISRQQWLAENS